MGGKSSTADPRRAGDLGKGTRAGGWGDTGGVATEGWGATEGTGVLKTDTAAQTSEDAETTGEPGGEAEPSGVWNGPQVETRSLAGSEAGGGPGGPAGPAPELTLRTTRARRKASTATRTWAEPGTTGEDSGRIEERVRPEVRGA